MEFDNIHLPPFVIAGLYKNALVLLDGDMAPGSFNTNNQLEQNSFQQQTAVGAAPNSEPRLYTETPAVVETDRQAITTIVPNVTEKTINVTDFQSIAKNEKISTTVKNPSIIPPQPVIKYLGGFGKKVAIVLEDHFHPNINDDDLAFLSKLLQACQLSLSDVAIVNVVTNQSISNQLWQLMPAEKMIIFEVDPGTIGLPFRLSHFKLQPWSDCIFLASPSLSALQEGTSEKVVQLKRNLWESLKKMFLV